MKKILPLVLIFILILNFLPEKASANAAVKIVAGSTAEKILVGIGEKAGVTFSKKNARDLARDRWNLELKKKFDDQTTPIDLTAKYQELYTELSNAQVVPLADKPGWSKAIISGAAFATGADLIYEGYHAFKNAYDTNKFVEVMGEHVTDGTFYTTYKGIKMIPQELTFSWTTPDLPKLYEIKMVYANDDFIMYDGTPQGMLAGFTSYFTVVGSTITLFWHGIDINGSVQTGSKRANLNSNYLDTNADSIAQIQPTVSDIPNLNVPQGMGTVALPGLEPIPEIPNLPDAVEIIIPTGPLADIDPATQVANDPISLTDPVTDPVPVPDPGADISPGKDPSTELDIGRTPPTGGDMPTEGSKLNFRPLVLAAEDITHKFPFSIPWDLSRQLNVFNVKPVAPEIDIDFSKFPMMKPDTKYTLSLKLFDPIAAGARWMLTIAIDIAFILMMRRLMPE